MKNSFDDRLHYEVHADGEGKKLQDILSRRMGLSSGMIKTLKYHGGLLLDGRPAKTDVRVQRGQTVTALLNCCSSEPKLVAEKIPLQILYEDNSLIAVNKPPAMPVHPAGMHHGGTLSNALLYYLQQKGIRCGIHLVSRLDRDTSGIVIAARNGYVQEALKRQAADGIFQKIYIGVTTAPPPAPKGFIDLPIARKPGSIMERQAVQNGAPARTYYQVCAVHPPYALVAFRLETGRTHQIRVHCKYSGFPLAGDTLYGPDDAIPPEKERHFSSLVFSRQALHAYAVNFRHPITQKKLLLTAPLPADIPWLSNSGPPQIWKTLLNP